jgi:hypothetical protein
MLVGLAFLPFVLMLVLWHRRITDWRDRFIVASVAWGFYAVGVTELLSVFNAITPFAICAGWAVGAVLVCIGLKFVHFTWPESPAAEPFGNEKYVLIPQISLIAAVLALVAWIGPPNNWDSMAYHMTRVIHWMQNRNVAFFPTGSLRQNEMPPGAEYFILHFQLLSGTDRWANMIQWFAYLGSIIGVSSISRLLGGGPRSQLLAATFAATLPMACLQSGTTQNDMVSAFWLICFIIFLLHLRRAAYPSSNWIIFAFGGASLGLALLTKTTMYVLAAPFCVGLVIFIFRRAKSQMVGGLVLLAFVAILINIPTGARNYRFTHHFLGNGGFAHDTSQYVNLHPGIGATTSNILRNLGLEFAAGPPAVLQTVEYTVRSVHRWIGLDTDNPDTTLGYVAGYDLFHTEWNSEDHAPNPFHVILIMTVLVTMLLCWRNQNRSTVLYAAAIVAGFVLFCAYLRMQPWHCRLHLPLLVASSALVGVVIERQWKPAVSILLCALLPLLVTPWIILNYLHPLIGPNSIFNVPRENGYFAERHFHEKYLSIVDFAQKHDVKQLAVIGDGNCWEYPLQVMLRTRMPDVRIEAYPDNLTWPADALHTLNHGFDENLKPFLIVKLAGENAEIVDLVPKNQTRREPSITK